MPLLQSISLASYEKEANAIRDFAKHMERGGKIIQQTLYSVQRPYGLTDREYEIALLAAQRKSNIEIAQITYLSIATVRTHLRTIYEKTGIDSNSKNKRNLLELKLKP